VTGQAAPSDAELETASRQVIDRGHVFREPERMAEREHLHGDADLDPARARGEGRRHHQRRREHRAVLLEMDLGQPHGIEAEVLGRLHLGERFVERRRLRHPGRTLEFREEPRLHGDPLPVAQKLPNFS
jgi:hypothetical protein